MSSPDPYDARDSRTGDCVLVAWTRDELAFALEQRLAGYCQPRSGEHALDYLRRCAREAASLERMGMHAPRQSAAYALDAELLEDSYGSLAEGLSLLLEAELYLGIASLTDAAALDLQPRIASCMGRLGQRNAWLTDDAHVAMAQCSKDLESLLSRIGVEGDGGAPQQDTCEQTPAALTA